MTIYKPVHIENLIRLQLAVLKKLDLKESSFPESNIVITDTDRFLSIPEVKTALAHLDIVPYITQILVSVTPPHGSITIHTDIGPFALNIPIKNCNNTAVNFYKATQEPKFTDFTGSGDEYEGQGYLRYDPAHCALIDTLEMRQPYIIDVRVPHSVINYNDKYRVLISLRLSKDFKF